MVNFQHTLGASISCCLNHCEALRHCSVRSNPIFDLAGKTTPSNFFESRTTIDSRTPLWTVASVVQTEASNVAFTRWFMTYRSCCIHYYSDDPITLHGELVFDRLAGLLVFLNRINGHHGPFSSLILAFRDSVPQHESLRLVLQQNFPPTGIAYCCVVHFFGDTWIYCICQTFEFAPPNTEIDIENPNRKPRWGGTRETKGGKQAEAPIQDDTSSDPKQNASTSNDCDAQSKHQARLLFQIATGGEIDFWAFAAHEGASKLDKAGIRSDLMD